MRNATLDAIADDATETDANALKSIMAALTEQPTELADVALAQEIRTFLRSLPQADRGDLLRKLMAKGDHVVLRSILTAPAFLSGIADDEQTQIRADAAKAVDPDRYAKVETLRRGEDSAKKAVSAAIRVVEEAANEPPSAAPARAVRG